MKNFLLGLLFFSVLYANPYAADVGVCIVDLKFDGDAIKICELGQATVSQFNGYDALYGPGAMFSKVWRELRRLNPNLAVIFGQHMANLSSMYALPELCGKDNIGVISCEELCKKNNTIKKRTDERCRRNIAFYDGILVTFYTRMLKDILRPQQKGFQIPYLVLDKATTYWVNHKEHTNKLFDELGLWAFRPGCVVCDKKITDEQLSLVVSQMPSDFYVIKPLNASKGLGVIIVSREELVQTIKMLFCDESPDYAKATTGWLDRVLQQDEKNGVHKNQQNLGQTDKKENEYDYWQRDKNKKFLLEQFCPSKVIEIDGHPYDPTMRVVFILSNDGGKAIVTFLDAYWKLPAKSLDQKGSMTQQHKSHINKQRLSSAKVDADDYRKVIALLEPVLLRIYEKMLMQDYASSFIL